MKKMTCTLFLRLLFSIIYFISSIVLIFYYKEEIFNLCVTNKNWEIYYRLIWCFAAGLIGFSVYVGYIFITVWRGEDPRDKNPFPTYITLYLPMILATSSLIFFILNIYYESLGVLFFAGSFSISFLLGFYIDNLPGFLNVAINKLTK